MSGGSFTALAYGLYGDKLFDDYEQRFLKRDVQGEIIARAFNPRNWGELSSTGWGRSELASQLYDEILFNGATFGDLNRGKGPLILASATDISTGARFVFNQGMFDVICSDLNAVPLSRAAAASSAVPVVLSSDHAQQLWRHLQRTPPAWAKPFIDTDNPPRPAARAIRSLKRSAGLRRQRQSALPAPGRRRRVGQRGHARRARCAGSARGDAGGRHADAARQRAAGSSSSSSIRCRRRRPTGTSRSTPPGTVDILLKSAGTPIDAFSFETDRTAAGHGGALEDAAPASATRPPMPPTRIPRWPRPCACPDAEIYAIDVSFSALKDKAEFDYLNQQPTTFVLPAEAVDRLRAAAGTIITDSPEFKRLLKDVGGTLVAAPAGAGSPAAAQ